jgi:hypothetical protein
LLIDEVLSVGDMAFQEKCVDRMREFKRQGVAIAFVSHNLQAVSMLCERALYLRGSARACGDTQSVIEAYVQTVSVDSGGDANGVRITAGPLVDSSGQPVRVVRPNTALSLPVTYRAAAQIEDLTFGFLVHRTTDALVVYDGNVRGSEVGVPKLTPGQPLTVRFDFRLHLTRGHYHFECHVLHNPTRRIVARLRPAAVVAVDEHRTFAGLVDLELTAAVDQSANGQVRPDRAV